MESNPPDTKNGIAPRFERRYFGLYILALSLPVYYAFMILPLVNLRSYYDNFSASVNDELVRFYGYGLAIYVSLGILLLFSLIRHWSSRPLTLWPWLLVIAWLFVSIGWSINPISSATYSLLLVSVFAAAAPFSVLPERIARSICLLASISIALSLVYLFTQLPIGVRGIGGITPNLLAHCSFSFVALYFCSGARFRLVASALAFLICYYAQARTVTICILIFFVAYYVLLPRIRGPKSTQYFALFLVAIVTTLILFSAWIVPLVTSLSTEALGVNSTSRGSGSGFSGRADLWSAGFELLRGHELIGYGFRTRRSLNFSEGDAQNVHSGILNAALDVGYIGCLLLSIAYVTSMFAAARNLSSKSDGRDAVKLSFLLAMVPALVVEPNYLNFSNPSSFLMIFFIGQSLVKQRGLNSISSKVPHQWWGRSRTHPQPNRSPRRGRP
jgi:hypothetical protein